MDNKSITEIHENIYAYLTEELKDLQLRFTLRQRNVSERLNKGYWFSGNEHYLAISFWKGLDWRNKTPNIYFAVLPNGASTLDFVSYDDERKIAFFTGLSEVLGMKQLTKARTGEEFEHWIKNYRGTDYIAALDTFLKQDKKIIDAFIKSNDELKGIFEPIDENEFAKAKSRIDSIRAKIKRDQTFKSEYQEIKSITLKSLVFENISLFGTRQEILFNKNITCLIGLNGTGKTSILRALVLAFTGYEQNETMGMNDELLTERLRNLMRISGLSISCNPEFPKEGGFAEVYYTLESANDKNDETKFHNRVLFTSDATGPIISDDSESDFRNVIDDKYKSLFLAFPQIQGEPESHVNGIDAKYPHVKDALSMLNNKPDNRFGAFTDWLRGLNSVANDKIAKGNSTPPEKKLLALIFEIISEVTGEQISLQEIVVRESGNDMIWVLLGEYSSPILLELVSQGYNNVFGWVGYFMKRLVEVSPPNSDFTQEPGIVLIDEIDTYLHPKWQIKILEVLVRRFPKIQFVVTTHSPYVVGSIPSDKITIYTCKKQGTDVAVERFKDFTPYGANLDRLSEKVFGVEGRFVEDIRQRLLELEHLISIGKLQDAKSFLSEQLTSLDKRDPELLRSKMLIRTKEILAQ